MKARAPSLRWLATMVRAAMRRMGLPLALGLALASPARAAEDGGRQPTRRNAIVLGTHAKLPDWASSIGYQRAFGRRASAGLALEHGYQPRGYWHLEGVSETLSGQVWLGRVFHGVFAEASLTVAHQILVQQPRLGLTALAPGMALGFRWTHRSGLLLGVSGGLRWGRRVGGSDIVCTRAKYCTSVREGVYSRITADIGFVF